MTDFTHLTEGFAAERFDNYEGWIRQLRVALKILEMAPRALPDSLDADEPDAEDDPSAEDVTHCWELEAVVRGLLSVAGEISTLPAVPEEALHCSGPGFRIDVLRTMTPQPPDDDRAVSC